MGRAEGRRSAGAAARSLVAARRAAAAFPPQFWLATGGILVYVVGVDMCFPFETFYLNNGLHISMTVVGRLLGLTTLAGLSLQIVGGALADRLGRRVVLVVSVCGSAVLYIGLALSHSFPQVVAVVLFEACFGWSMFLTGSNAMVTDLVGGPRRAEAFSIVRTAINASMVIGPLIALPFLRAGPTTGCSSPRAAASACSSWSSSPCSARPGRRRAAPPPPAGRASCATAAC